MRSVFAPMEAGHAGAELLGLLDAGLLILVLVPTAFLLVAGLGIWLLVHRVRRSGVLRRLQDRAFGIVEDGGLRARARAGDGLSRELAHQRLRLRAALNSTAHAVAEARTHRPVGELPDILVTLTEAGRVLDGQLRTAEREPDPGARRTMSDALNGQLETIERTARDIRTALAGSAIPLAEAELGQVTGRVEVENRILAAWNTAYLASGSPVPGSVPNHVPARTVQGNI